MIKSVCTVLEATPLSQIELAPTEVIDARLTTSFKSHYKFLFQSVFVASGVSNSPVCLSNISKGS